MKYQLNKTDIWLMQVLESNEATNRITAMTIGEIMAVMESAGNGKNRTTVYRRLRQLVELGYIAKGVPDDHAATFYIIEKGKHFLKGEI